MFVLLLVTFQGAMLICGRAKGFGCDYQPDHASCPENEQGVGRAELANHAVHGDGRPEPPQKLAE